MMVLKLIVLVKGPLVVKEVLSQLRRRVVNLLMVKYKTVLFQAIT